MQQCCSLYLIEYICIAIDDLNKKLIHTTLSCFLIANLLFGQLVVNLLHDRHDAHEPTVELGAGKTAIQKHGEHCKVCSLDIIFNLYSGSSYQSKSDAQRDIFTGSIADNAELIHISFCKDRAPPRFI
jgi:hypothetical protein